MNVRENLNKMLYNMKNKIFYFFGLKKSRIDVLLVLCILTSVFARLLGTIVIESLAGSGRYSS